MIDSCQAKASTLLWSPLHRRISVVPSVGFRTPRCGSSRVTFSQLSLHPIHVRGNTSPSLKTDQRHTAFTGTTDPLHHIVRFPHLINCAFQPQISPGLTLTRLGRLYSCSKFHPGCTASAGKSLYIVPSEA